MNQVRPLLARSAILAGVGFADFVLAQLDRTPSRVLEIGCGDGQAALALAAAGHEVTAIDPVAPQGPIFERVTLEEFVPSAPFDAVVASRSLHHVPDLELAVDKIAQLAPLLVVDEFAWDRFDERTAAWYVAQLDGPSKSTQQCLRDWNEEHDGLHGSEDAADRVRSSLQRTVLRLAPIPPPLPRGARRPEERTGNDRRRGNRRHRLPLRRHTGVSRRASPLLVGRCSGRLRHHR